MMVSPGGQFFPWSSYLFSPIEVLGGFADPDRPPWKEGQVPSFLLVACVSAEVGVKRGGEGSAENCSHLSVVSQPCSAACGHGRESAPSRRF